ncbi:peptide ABC transporter substrate-binding protein [Chelativorans salis]|uniref:Peptide ABC transporter substrate-binding protein n=1 Tax=Chelativorans salis TaxID=2978478 RepID=A0ABT2LQH1_9HYPH|nr:peptide ABC transporter substrate-binding protein [Chelativorans sp. EGI FJ00035]MCT7376742.1 peptide ABC transporter substrate-binding protein [Chelativorans sp. EGI FJ00035]
MTGLKLLPALAALGLMTAPAAYAQADDEQLVLGARQFLTNFHPLVQVNNTKRNLINFSLRPLTAFYLDGNNVCVLCEELPTVENGGAKIVENADGSKGMEVTFKFKEGLSWGDGTPVTSDDVVFTWEMANDPNIGFSNYNPWTRASDVEVIDERTFVIHLPEVMQSYNSWDQVIPAHLERPIYEANKDLESYTRQTLYNREPDNPGLWNGSYVLSDYAVGQRVGFGVNPHWPGKTPDIERIVVSYRDNSSALLQAVLADEIETIVVSPGGISFEQMLELRKQHPDRFQFFVRDGTNLERIAVNLDNPALADLKVRQALMHGIDRQAITDALFEGLQAAAHTFESPVSPYYNPDVRKYEFDPEKAKQLLAEADWTPGPDGICVNDNGDRLSFEFVTTAGNTTREQLALVIQSQLKDICVETQNKFVGLQEYNGEYARKRGFSGMILSSIQFSPSTSPRIALGSDAIPTEENAWVGNNFSGYASEHMDEAVAGFEQSLEETEKAKYSGQVQEIFAEDLPMLPLYFYAAAYVAIPQVGNFNSTPFDVNAIWAEEWTLN